MCVCVCVCVRMRLCSLAIRQKDQQKTSERTHIVSDTVVVPRERVESPKLHPPQAQLLCGVAEKAANVRSYLHSKGGNQSLKPVRTRSLYTREITTNLYTELLPLDCKSGLFRCYICRVISWIVLCHNYDCGGEVFCLCRHKLIFLMDIAFLNH